MSIFLLSLLSYVCRDTATFAEHVGMSSQSHVSCRAEGGSITHHDSPDCDCLAGMLLVIGVTAAHIHTEQVQVQEDVMMSQQQQEQDEQEKREKCVQGGSVYLLRASTLSVLQGRQY